MITKTDFVTIFDSWARVFDLQTEGLSREDLFFQPQPGGNCIYWTLGHIMVNFISLAKVIQMPLPDFVAKYQDYAHGSEPVLADSPELPGLEQIHADYHQMSDLLSAAILAKDEAYFAEPSERGGTHGTRMNFYAFHQAYHLGQLETLRNLTGHTEKLI